MQRQNGFQGCFRNRNQKESHAVSRIDGYNRIGDFSLAIINQVELTGNYLPAVALY